MKLAFIDVTGNKLDAYEACTQLCESHVADVTLSRITAPDLLKVPVCAKRALEEGAEAAIVFYNATAEDSHALDLVHEKIIDVELESRKFVFFTLVFEDEWRSPQQLAEVAQERLAQSLEALFRSVHSESSEPVEQAPVPEEGSMGMFAQNQESEEQAPELPPSGGGRGLF
jgi:riboflavin synthase